MKTKTFFIVVSVALLALTVYAVKERAKEQSAEVKGAADFGESAGGGVALNSTMDKVSYAIGLQMGQNFKARSVEINLEMFVRGVRDGVNEREPALRPEEMRQVMQDFQKEMMAKQQQRHTEEAAKNLAESRAFLEENKNKPGVTVLASGLQYRILQEGTGQRPTASDSVKVHYRGTLINGREFDSSYRRNQPAEFAVKGVIAGWTEALQLMKKGAKWQVFIPPNLAYGQRGTPNIGPNSTLIFEVELLDVIKQEDTTKARKPDLGQP